MCIRDSNYLAQYPSIKVVLDVHRDAIQTQDGTRYAPAANINGRRAAQVMIICGADVDGNLPNCKQNLGLAARWQAKMAQLYPGLARPVLFDYRYYNQDPVSYTHLFCARLENGTRNRPCPRAFSVFL